MSTTMTIRLDAELKHRLDQLVHVTQRSRSVLAGEALRGFVEHNEWQILEIKKAVAEADNSEFASESEVKRMLSKWGVSAAQC